MPLKTLRACALAEVFPGPGMRRAQWLLSERGGGGPEEMLRPPLPLRNLERNGNWEFRSGGKRERVHFVVSRAGYYYLLALVS